ncbi:hypothetical protein Tco_0646565 [Tanacetum coccineum]
MVEPERTLLKKKEIKLLLDEEYGSRKSLKIDVLQRRLRNSLEVGERKLHGINRLVDEYERSVIGVICNSEDEHQVKGRIIGFKRLQDILRVNVAQLQLLSDYYCWKDYADREGIKIDWRTRILTKIRLKAAGED